MLRRKLKGDTKFEGCNERGRPDGVTDMAGERNRDISYEAFGRNGDSSEAREWDIKDRPFR